MKVSVEFQELDRKKTIKRIIAREGLIFLLWWIFWLIIQSVLISIGNKNPSLQDNIGTVSVLLFYLYPIYAYNRFLFWGVKFLREKSGSNKKQIIVREALIFTSVVISFIVNLFLGFFTKLGSLFIGFQLVILLFYIVYLLFRLITWVVRTLREGK